MQRILFINSLFVMIMLSWQICVAQSGDTAATDNDTAAIVKLLVKEQLALELKKSAACGKLQQDRLVELLRDTAAVDTLSKLMLQHLQQIKNAGTNAGKTLVMNSGQTTRQLLEQQFASAMQMQALKDIFNRFTGMLKQPLLAWKNGSVSSAGQTVPSALNGETVFMNSISVNAGLSVLGIPVSLQFTRQDFTGSESAARNIFSFQFDREAYLNGLRDKIKHTVSATNLLQADNAVLQQIKKEMLNGLHTSLDSISMAYKGVLKKQFEQLGDPQNLLEANLHTLQDKLLDTDFIQDIENKKNQLAQLQQQLNTGEIINRPLFDSLTVAVRAVKGVQAMIEKIQSVKNKAQSSGLLEQLQQAAKFKAGGLQQCLQDPEKLKTLAKQQLDLNGLQRLFLNINRLQAGMNNISLSPLTLNQYVNNGFNASFVSKKTYLFVMAGKQTAFSGRYDRQFAGSSLFSTDNTAMGFRMGKGDLPNSHAHFSVFSYAQHGNSYNNNLVNTVPGKMLVFTFSNQLIINEGNYFNLEISKSAHRYDNQKNSYDSLLRGNSLSRQLLATDNFMQQLAVTLQWNGTMKDKDLEYEMHGTYIGKGYSNPGSLFLSSGMTALGGSVKKSMLQNRLQIAARANYRAYAYSINNAQYINYNFSFQAKWKLKKAQYISLSYQPYQSLKWDDGKKIAIGGSNRLALDMNLNRRFGNTRYQHIIGLALLTNKYGYDTVRVMNSSVLISSMQTVTINRKSYYLSMQYTKANLSSALAVFNTQFTCDAGFVYSIGKTITASTAINYNSTKDWFKQLGVKQGVSGRLGEKCVLGFYTAIQKNIKQYKLYSMDNIRLDWTLHYLLK